MNYYYFLLLIPLTLLIFVWTYLYKKIPPPTANYTRITAAILLIVLVWGFSVSGSNRGPGLILTGVALSVLIKEFIAIRKFYISKKIKQ
jgi:hypothetical protein